MHIAKKFVYTEGARQGAPLPLLNTPLILSFVKMNEVR